VTLVEAVRSRRILIARADEETPPESREVLRLIGAEMAVAVPLFVRERLVGAMTISFDRARPFDADDLALVETIGGQAAVAIDDARLFGNLTRQREQLARINEIGRVLTSTLDLQTIYSTMREQLEKIMDCKTMLVSLYDSETGMIRCAFAYTDGEVLSPDQFEPLKLGGGPHSESIRTARPLIVDNIARRHPGSFRYVGHTESYPVSIIYVPMIVEGRVIGVIQAQSLREGAYTETDIPMLSIIANQAAIAIQNAGLYLEAVEGRRAVERANRLKDEFLAMISHELRTPLTPILGWTRILSNLPPEDVGTRAHALRVIERNTRLQSQLVNDLLDLSRMESGKISITPEPTDLNAAVEAAIESMRGEADDRQIQIVRRLAPGVLPVMADPARLGQIINNLLANAVKFTDEGGRVTVITEQSDGSCVIKVSDTGVGIARDFLPYVFDKFRQADSSLRRRHGGLGLGLSIVRSLAEMQGGQALAHSDGPGRGATFTVRLPMGVSRGECGRSGEPASSTRPDAQADTRSDVELLLVEDDADTLDMMRVLCDAHRMKVKGARTAEEALAFLRHETPDLIISDISLPGADGHDLARLLRSDPRLREIPLIALTGLVTEQDRARALAAGFDAHLTKPINYTELFDLINNLTGPRVATSR
jgi:signal transduction histidine kinase/CheY-like chemotaxis protein